MKLTKHEIEVMLEEAENAGLKPYKGTYNGRCYAVCEHAIIGCKDEYKQLLSNVIITAVSVALDGEVDMAEHYQNIAEWLVYARIDNFGKDYIWY